MRTLRILALTALAMLPDTPAVAADAQVKSKIVGVDLFKNGLAIVKRELTLPKPGTYDLEDVPSPIHGTFWIDSSGGTVDVVVRMRDVAVPVGDVAPGSLQDDLAGKIVTVHLKGENRAPITGTMVKFKPAKPDELAAVGRFLVIQTDKGRVYLEPSEVSSVEAAAGDTVVRRRPQMLLTLHEGKKAENKGETKVSIRYIANGLSWAPSYRLDISDPKTLSLEQHAVVRNELGDLDGAEVRLISGYPSVEYAHVRSPLSPLTNWAGFFAELANQRHREIDALSNSIVSQQAISFNYRSASPLPALGATPAGEGVDLHYQSIGKRTLGHGDTLSLTVAKGKADYERIVEWLVPDTRNADGRLERHDARDDVWDALRFKNPLSFPMTTGPAAVVSGGQFNGQRTSFWVNSGEETILRVEKALSVRTRATENELLPKDNGSARDFIWLGGRQYRKTTVEGEVAVSNNRKETISLVIRRRFSGELVSADADPKRQLREEGVYSVNKRQELLWTLALKGGDEKRLKYSYTVLVPH